MAFDTGPGNMVIDALARELGQPYDRGGRSPHSGRVNRELLDRLLADPYYRRKPPKSAGREQYGAAFVDRLKKTGLPMKDWWPPRPCLQRRLLRTRLASSTPTI